jgi:tetratricopeptide (TPR) repeat protein
VTVKWAVNFLAIAVDRLKRFNKDRVPFKSSGFAGFILFLKHKFSSMFNYFAHVSRLPLFSPQDTPKKNKPLFHVSLLGLSFLIMSSMIGCNHHSSSVPMESSVRTVDTVEMVEQGIEKSRLGNYEAAVEDFEQVITENPQDINAYFNRGYAYSSLGKFEEALADFTQALTLDPQMGQAYVNRGNVYLQLGEDKEAIADYEKALKINPHDAFAQNNLGLAHLNSGSPELAKIDFTQAVTIDPLYGEAYYNRGLAFVDLGEPQKAIADFEKAAQIWEELGEDMASQAAIAEINALKTSTKSAK